VCIGDINQHQKTQEKNIPEIAKNQFRGKSAEIKCVQEFHDFGSFFSATRNLALRERGLTLISSLPGSMGFLLTNVHGRVVLP
jgi:hypothetical protein